MRNTHIVCVTNTPREDTEFREIKPAGFMQELGWYFFDETYSEHGPFDTLETCQDAYDRYVMWLNGGP